MEEPISCFPPEANKILGNAFEIVSKRLLDLQEKKTTKKQAWKKNLD